MSSLLTAAAISLAFTLFLTPVFYVALRLLATRKQRREAVSTDVSASHAVPSAE